MEVLFLVNSVTAKFSVSPDSAAFRWLTGELNRGFVRLKFFRNASMVFDSSFLCIPKSRGTFVICVTQCPEPFYPIFSLRLNSRVSTER